MCSVALVWQCLILTQKYLGRPVKRAGNRVVESPLTQLRIVPFRLNFVQNFNPLPRILVYNVVFVVAMACQLTCDRDLLAVCRKDRRTLIIIHLLELLVFRKDSTTELHNKCLYVPLSRRRK